MQAHPEKWVAGHVSTLPKSGIRDFFELVAKMKGQDVISLGVGEPDFRTPDGGRFRGTRFSLSGFRQSWRQGDVSSALLRVLSP